MKGLALLRAPFCVRIQRHAVCLAPYDLRVLLLISGLGLAHTHLHQEGLHELHQLANGDDGTSHRLSSVVNDVDGILNRLLVEQLSEGNVTLLVGEV